MFLGIFLIGLEWGFTLPAWGFVFLHTPPSMRRSPNWHPAQLGNKSLDLGILGAETPDGVSVSGARMADLVNHLGGVCS